jgi:hypothetical protein
MPIQSYYNLAQLQTALNAIQGIGTLSISFSNPNSPVCNTAFNVITIRFLTNFGPQPPLVPVVSSAMSAAGGFVTVSAAGSVTLMDSSGKLYSGVAGTKENDACSNRGYCEKANGICSCYNTNGDAYGSSDGYGVVGTRGDCGWEQLPIRTVAVSSNCCVWL